MKIRSCAIFPFLLIALYTLLPAVGNAQSDFSLQYKDSVELTDASQEWISNDIIVSNNLGKQLKLAITVSLPQHWQMAGKTTQTVLVNANDKLVFPINIVRSLKALATWQAAKIVFLNTENNKKDSVLFYLKSIPITLFLLEAPETEFTLDKEKKYLDLTVVVRNKGNVDEELTINAKNNYFELNNTVTKKLKPGTDYTYNLRLKVTNAILKSLENEEVRISVRNKILKTKTLNLVVNNNRSFVKENHSTYPTLPVQLETGVFRYSKTMTFYSGISGYIPLPGDKKINFSYRTRQLGIANSIEQNTFSLEYRTKNWILYAGQLSDVGSFFSFGQGISATYMSPKKVETNISAIFHYRANPYKNDVFSWYTKHKLGKVTLKQGIALNNVPSQSMFALVATNEIGLFKTKDFNLSLDLNAGQNHYNFKLPAYAKERAGIAAGYTLDYQHKHFILTSMLFKAGSSYPGNFAGLENQSHSLTFLLKKISLTGYYSYNSSNPATIFFRDTVFNSNFFDFDFEQYGVSTGFKAGKNLDLKIGAGQYKQRGSYLRSQFPTAKFIEVGATYVKGSNLRISFSSNNGFNDSYGPKNENVWISRSSFSFRYKTFGVNAFYFRTPGFQSGLFSTDTLRLVRETMSISPFVNVLLFRKLKFGLNYNLFRSLYDNTLATSAGVSLSYNNKRNGFEAIFTGAIPISNTSSNFSSLANNGMQLSMKKNLNMPIPFKRKYYDLEVLLFEDLNLNGKMDEEEIAIKDVVVSIAKRRFITSSEGTVVYKNISKKLYAIDLSGVKAPRGFISSGGNLHFAKVEKDTRVLCPFHKGKVISGKITVKLDSLSEKEFTPEKLKVFALDTAGNYYKTLADKNGEYYINVPPGRYKVSLNPEAFSKDIKPVTMFYWVELGLNKEEEFVNFEIVENKRKVRFLKKD